jgi:hypothetical protein
MLTVFVVAVVLVLALFAAAGWADARQRALRVRELEQELAAARLEIQQQMGRCIAREVAIQQIHQQARDWELMATLWSNAAVALLRVLDPEKAQKLSAKMASARLALSLARHRTAEASRDG